jgi:hypothetical protein
MDRIRAVFILILSTLLLSGCGGIFSALLGNGGVTYNSIQDDIARLNGQDSLDDGLVPGTGDGSDINDDGLTGDGSTDGDGGHNDDKPCCDTPGGDANRNVTQFDLDTVRVPNCHVGEIDILNYGLVCHENLPLIATLKDKNGEKLIKNFGTLKANPDLVEELKALKNNASYAGDSVELFLCLDGNKNNSCMDEKVGDLKELSKRIANFVRMSVDGQGFELAGNHHNKEDDDDDDFNFERHPNRENFGKNVREFLATLKEEWNKNSIAQLCSEDDIREMSQGLVLYHSRHKIGGQEDFSPSAIVAKGTTEVVESYIQNLRKKDIPGEYVKEALENDTPQFILVEYDTEYCKEIGGRLGGGCFVKGTEIKTGKTTSLDVELLRAGDEVLLANGQYTRVTDVVKGPEEKPVLEFTLSNKKKVTVTETHPMLTQRGLLQAKDVSAGDQFKSQNQWISVESVKTKKYKDDVYNIVLFGDSFDQHLLISNDIVTGDLFLQRKLSEQKEVMLYFVNLDSY